MANLKNEDMQVLLGDFDLVHQKVNDDEENPSDVVGTILFVAPEMIKKQKYDSKVDVWALGTLFYEMITGFVPFNANDAEDFKKCIEVGNYFIPKDLSLSLNGLAFLNSCLRYSPEDRMTRDELINHSYLNEEEESDDSTMLGYEEIKWDLDESQCD